MKKFLKVLALVLGLSVMACMLFACNNSDNGGNNNGDNGDGGDNGGNTETTYYLTGSFNNYTVDSADYKMQKLPKEHAFYQSYPDADLYWFIVPSDDMTPDEVNDGHYYKVTAGDWDHCWGTDTYALQPAPVNGTYGLGSIYIPIDYDFGTAGLKVIFDAKTKTIYDNTMKRDITPRVYGDFHASFGLDKTDWSYTDENSFVMTETTDGVWETTMELPAFTNAEGAYASVSVLWGELFYIDMGADYDGVGWTQMQWAANGAKQKSITETDFKQDTAKTYKVTLNEASGEVTVTVVE